MSYNLISKKQTTQLKMGRIPKYIFLQGRHTDGQQAYEKMFNITNHEEYANQNQNAISPHTCQNGYCQKDKKIINIA